MDEYQPTAADTQWLINLLDMIREGGIWGTSFAVYRIDKANQTLHEVDSDIPFVIDNPDENRARVRAVAKAIGWQVV